ncbi:Fic family protein [Myroides phaeus]|uniref:Fic family protein n=1 Tax=Myroides phaeus TaxID=702745 RepID=UPI002DBFE4D2|nr:Fic family protein [Myroides phaeus]MEC4116731.1 Fic family protein [Myroides phaeus]
MSQPTFKTYELELIKPDFDSRLTDLIIELEHLRKKQLGGSTHPQVFFQLKHLFHTLESIGSARIEGNNTTIAEYIETKLENDESKNVSDEILEIKNIEKAMEFIEENILDYPINKTFISELHKIIVDGLPIVNGGEGDRTPGIYRSHNIKISNSNHLPPEPFFIDEYMEEMFSFISNDDSSKYDLLKSAIAHHRFVWIHPFGNGNGRTVRLFTYAMLIKNGFNLNVGRIVNPTAVFCNNRNEYYDKLSKADEGTADGILEWSEYVLNGLKEEIEKIDKLSDYQFLKTEILLPSINFSLNRKIITDLEAKILKETIEKQVMQNLDLEKFFKDKAKSEISRQIKKLIEKKMLMPEEGSSRKYVLRFDNNYLLRGVISMLDEKGFLPLRD